MHAGRILGLVSHDQLNVIIDKASDNVFGMDVNEWLAKRKPATLSEDELDMTWHNRDNGYAFFAVSMNRSIFALLISI
jgi:hypothetical protein